ncbi:MAG: rhodanese-like domain-containing protein [Nitrospirae bacterium]|nr:rhodanese-like domain-containing protein [Nitrospirota bacterium]
MRQKLIVVMLSFTMTLTMLLTTKLNATDDAKSLEKKVFSEFKEVIPKENIKTVDDLYKRWSEVREELHAGKSKVVILDIRTEAEFDSGHICDSNNIDSGLVYTVPEKIPDTDTEIWVFCRTQNRGVYFTGLLMKYGYKKVYLVEKGIAGWAEKGYPLVNKYMGEIKVTNYQHKFKEGFSFRENK